MRLKKNIVVVAVLLAAASLVSVSFAALLGIVPEFPRMSFDSGDTVYDAGNDLLSIQAFPSVIELSPTDPLRFINPPSEGVTIGVTVDDTGALVGGVTGPDLIVEGEVDLDGDAVVDYAGVLLTGEVSGFGFRDNIATDEYDFRFTLTGGHLAFLYAGKDLGVTVTSESSTFTGDFTGDFAGNAKGILGGIPAAGSIGDFVWEDLNADGIQDVGEPGIGGVTVNLYSCGPDGIAGTGDDVFVTSTTTAADGSYLFGNLAAEQYFVQFVAPSGFVFSPKDQGADDSVDSDADPATANTVCTTLDIGESDLTLDAGLYRPASLGDFVWNDLDQDGIQDAGEPGIPGVTVNLYDCGPDGIPGTGDDVFLSSTTTDAGGLYLFSNLVPGSYFVEFVAPSGFVFSPKDQGGDDALDSDANPANGKTDCTALESGEDDLTVDAGLFEPSTAEIGDFVWNDVNVNGIQDAGEPGIPGVTVNLYDCGPDGIPGTGDDVFLASTSTDAVGFYLFTNLVPGNYFVEFVAPAGMVFSPQNQGGDDSVDSDADPTTGQTVCFALGAGQSDRTRDAGLFQPCTLEVLKTCFVPPPPTTPGDDCQGKVISMNLVYTGQGCDATSHTQDPRKVKCIGDANDSEPVDVLVTNKKKDKIYADLQGVGLNEEIQVAAAAAGRDNLDSETLVRIFGSQVDLIEEVLFHTSCSQPLNVGNQFGSLQLSVLTTTEGGTVTLTEPPAPDPISDCTIQAAPPPPHCDGKVRGLSLAYLGGDCSEGTNPQGGKALCEGDAGLTEPVRILAVSKKDSNRVFLDTGVPASVSISDVVDVAAANAGRSELDSEMKVTVFDAGGNLIQTLNIHTSCSQPLDLGDRFGSLEVFGMDTTGGGSVALTTEVEYTYEITNTGVGTVSNVTVIDDVLGEIPGSPIPSIGPGEAVTLTLNAAVSETTTNTVTVTGNPGPSECAAEASATVTVEEPPPAPKECTTRVKAMLLLYTGPEILGAEVKIFADKFSSEPVIYDPVDLIPGVTVLSSPAQNDWTIDATAQGQSELGAKTTIYINGTNEVLHTSCSTPFVADLPVPLDNPKGDPSPNWFVVDFIQK